MKIKHEIGQRLRVWGEAKYGNLSKFAQALEMRQQNLSAYVRGLRIPGNLMQEKLRNLGCDITWLMTGTHKELLGHRFGERLKEHLSVQDIGVVVTKEDAEMLKVLKQFGIDSREKIENFLNPTYLLKDINLVIKEKLSRYKNNK